MKNLKLKKITLLFFIILLSFSVFNSNYLMSFAEENVEEVKTKLEENTYTEDYKKYLELSDEEKVKLNVIPEKYEYTMEEYLNDKSQEISFFGSEVTIPSYFNLRDEIEVKTENQGSHGLCWAFASNNAVETYLALNTENNYDFSEMHVDYLTSLEFNNETGKGTPCRYLHTGGNFSIYYERYGLCEYGPVLESEVPYVEISSSNYSSLLNYRPSQYIYDIKRFPNFTWYNDAEKTIVRNDVKKHIMTNGSLYATICSKNIYQPYGADAVLNEQNLSNQYIRDHAISIIGWDDNYSIDNFPAWCRPANNGAYIALNSWGNYFGDDGIFYISYEDILVEGEMSGVTYVDSEPYTTDTVTFKDKNLYFSVLNAGYGELIESYNDDTLTITAKEQYFRLLDSIYAYAVHDFSGLEKYINLTTLYIQEDYSNKNVYDYSSLANITSLSNISFGNINASSWEFLEELDNLYALELSNTNLLDLNLLSNVSSLGWISFYNNSLVNSYNYNIDLSKLSNLECFYTYLPIGHNGVYKIIGLPDSVTDVMLNGTEFADDVFYGKNNLWFLELSNITVNDLNFLSSSMNKLELLALRNTNTYDVGNLGNLNHNIVVEFYSTCVPDFMHLLEKDNIKFYFYDCYKNIVITEPIVAGASETIDIPNDLLFFMNDYNNVSAYYSPYPLKSFVNGASIDESGKKFVVKKDEISIDNCFEVFLADEDTYDPYESHTVRYSFFYDTVDISQIEEPKVTVNYRTHVQNVGWQQYAAAGTTSGTEGKGFRLEGINIDLISNVPGSIEYTTHVQNIGWQDYVSDNEMAGTSGKGLRLEGIKIRLTGELAELYDVYYRVHAQNVGWLSWAKNDQVAGSSGYGYRLEGIQIVIVEKDEEPPEMYPEAKSSDYFKEKVNVIYQTHTENIGWQANVRNGATQGAPGQHLRIEGIKIKTESTTEGSIRYATHVQNIGWQDFVDAGQYAGTEGRGLRLEGIKIELTGELAEKYDVYYRIYVENMGWLDWASNGIEAGSTGYGLKLEGIEVKIQKKGSNPPGATENPCYNKNAPIIGEE